MYQLVEWEPFKEPLIGTQLGDHISIVKQVKDQHLKRARYVENEFLIQLKGSSKSYKSSNEDDFLVCYIGKRDDNSLENEDYNLDTNQFKDKRHCQNYIRVSSQNEVIKSTQYLMCLMDLMSEAIKLNKKLIIYAEVEDLGNGHGYRSLLDKVIHKLLIDSNGTLIYRTHKDKMPYRKSEEAFACYQNQYIYTSASCKEAIDKFKAQLRPESKRIDRAKSTELYDDIFYSQIPDEQEIYVPVTVASSISPTEYERLGFEYIPIISSYDILRGTKAQFNQSLELLYDNVSPQFRPQVLLPAPIRQDKEGMENNNLFVPSSLYKGKDVYIGIISGEGIDYENPLLMDRDNKTRIEYIWEQIRGNTGNEYNEEMIQRAIATQGKLSVYPDQGEYLATTILGIAAGSATVSKSYEGMGSDSKLLVAKIKKAPEEIQKVYAGTTSSNSVLLEDICIGINQIIEFATAKRKPVVICLPYGSNISGHDGKKILETRIGAIAIQPGVTIMTMTGEEADKAHHATLPVNNGIESRVNVVIGKEKQVVVGTIWISPVYEIDINLYNPIKDKYYDLTQRAKYVDRDEVIISNGERVRFYNGIKQIFFTMENLDKGTWQLIIKEKVPHHNTYEAKVDVWIAQEAINKYIKLAPADVFTTITSLGNIENLICVGNYDDKIFNVEKTSGRGYTRDHFIKPTLVTIGKDIPAAIGVDEWGSVTGSVAAMAKMAGVASAIYSKQIADGERWMPNSLVMESIMLSSLDRVELVDYPNPSQGNGIFNQYSANKILESNSAIAF